MPARDKPLSEATIQDIQLELIRRRRFNEFDGRKIAASLADHQELWRAAYMDRLGVYDEEHPDWIPAMSLIPLRDLPGNRWNVDTLFVLTKDHSAAERLAEIAAAEQWNADEVIVQDNEKEIRAALGAWPVEGGLVTFWWD